MVLPDILLAKPKEIRVQGERTLAVVYGRWKREKASEESTRKPLHRLLSSGAISSSQK